MPLVATSNLGACPARLLSACCGVILYSRPWWAQLLDANGEGSVQKSDVLPIFAKRLETKETTDQLVAAFRVFDKQNRGEAPSCWVSSSEAVILLHTYCQNIVGVVTAAHGLCKMQGLSRRRSFGTFCHILGSSWTKPRSTSI
jgi:hypothetical protein